MFQEKKRRRSFSNQLELQIGLHNVGTHNPIMICIFVQCANMYIN